MGVSLAIFILLALFSTWYAAVGAVLLLAAIVYVALSVFRRYPNVVGLIANRTGTGKDLCWQAMLALDVFVVLIAFYWGY